MSNLSLNRTSYPYFKEQYTKIGSSDLGADPITNDIFYINIGCLYDGLYLILKKMNNDNYLETVHKINLSKIKFNDDYIDKNLIYYDFLNDGSEPIHDIFNFIGVCLGKSSGFSIKNFTFYISVLNKLTNQIYVFELSYYGEILQKDIIDLPEDKIFNETYTITLLRGKNFINKKLYIYFLFSYLCYDENLFKIKSFLKIYELGKNKFDELVKNGIELVNLNGDSNYSDRYFEWNENSLPEGVIINNFIDFYRRYSLIDNDKKNINSEIYKMIDDITQEKLKYFKINYSSNYIDKDFVYSSCYTGLGNFAGVTTLIYNNYEGGFTIDYRNGILYYTCQEPAEIFISYFSKQNYHFTDPEEDYKNGINNAEKFIYDLSSITNIYPTINPPNFIKYHSFMNIKIKTPMIEIGPRKFILPHEIFESSGTRFVITYKDFYKHAGSLLE